MLTRSTIKRNLELQQSLGIDPISGEQYIPEGGFTKIYMDYLKTIKGKTFKPHSVTPFLEMIDEDGFTTYLSLKLPSDFEIQDANARIENTRKNRNSLFNFL